LLRTNKHFNRYLQNSWNKHGEQHFIFEVVELVEDINIDLDLLETRSVEKARDNGTPLFNLAKPGKCPTPPLGIRSTTINKWLEKDKQEIIPPDVAPLIKPVVVRSSNYPKIMVYKTPGIDFDLIRKAAKDQVTGVLKWW
jgi:hypothetical protein